MTACHACKFWSRGLETDSPAQMRRSRIGECEVLYGQAERPGIEITYATDFSYSCPWFEPRPETRVVEVSE